MEKYFEDLDGSSNSPTESDGFDFIEEDQNANDISVPIGMSNLLDGEILNKGSGKKQVCWNVEKYCVHRTWSEGQITTKIAMRFREIKHLRFFKDLSIFFWDF